MGVDAQQKKKQYGKMNQPLKNGKQTTYWKYKLDYQDGKNLLFKFPTKKKRSIEE